MSIDTSEISNASASGVPDWIDATLVQKALLCLGDNPNATVKAISIERATAPGDNYASIIYRIQVKLDDGSRQCSLLVKTTPNGEALANAVIEAGLFQREINMLGKFIPAMQELLERVAPGRFPPFAARCPLHGSTPAHFIVLEDLKPQGFRLAQRHRGLGLRHSLLAIRTLAHFHAASAALLAEDPSIANNFSNPFKTENGSWDGIVTGSVQMSADACKNIPGMEEYVEILERFKPKAMEIIIELNNTHPGKFNVLLHGDFWINNMMFKYDTSDQLKDFRMVDLQITHVASPAIDLQYFFHTSLSDDVYNNHQRLLIREYHTSLIETLTLLGMTGPSFKELMAELNYHGSYALLGALEVWPIARAEAVPDINASLEGDLSSSNSMYKSETMKRWLQCVLPKFKNRGWLNF